MKVWEITVTAQKGDLPQETFCWRDLEFFGIIGILEKVSREVRFFESGDYKILGITIRRIREEMPNL